MLNLFSFDSCLAIGNGRAIPLSHKQRVIDAVKGYCKGKKRKRPNMAHKSGVRATMGRQLRSEWGSGGQQGEGRVESLQRPDCRPYR